MILQEKTVMSITKLGALIPFSPKSASAFSCYKFMRYFDRCILKFLGVFAKLQKATISFVMSVCPSARNNSAPTGWILMKFDI
jgi:hypothetical protein